MEQSVWLEMLDFSASANLDIQVKWNQRLHKERVADWLNILFGKFKYFSWYDPSNIVSAENRSIIIHLYAQFTTLSCQPLKLDLNVQVKCIHPQNATVFLNSQQAYFWLFQTFPFMYPEANIGLFPLLFPPTQKVSSWQVDQKCSDSLLDL